MTCSFPKLPGEESGNDAARRKHWIEANLPKYRFSFRFLDPIPMIDHVPIEESFPARYTVERNRAQQLMPENMLYVQGRMARDPLDSLQDYENFYPKIAIPSSIRHYRQDSFFGEQRLSGLNPVAIRRVEKGQFPGSKSTIDAIEADGLLPLDPRVGTPIKLEEAIARGLIFVADYHSWLKHVRGGTYQWGYRYCPKPRAYFLWKGSGYSDWGELAPLAIEFPDAKTGNQFFSPRSTPLQWMLAKTAAQVADANHHEMSTHLARSHFTLEVFACVTPMTLGENHPVARLLRPHLRCLIFNNELGRYFLVNKGGPVESLLAGDLEGSLGIVTNSYRDWNLIGSNFINDLNHRGFYDHCLENEVCRDSVHDDLNPVIPHYPYRDDGLLIWRALEEFITNYLQAFYGAEDPLASQAIRGDAELQSWAQMLGGPRDGTSAGVPGMPASIEGIAQLVEVLTSVIFACGPGHSAVNFPQYDYLGFVPNQPLAAYRDFPAFMAEIQPGTPEEQTVMSYLPPFGQSAGQLQIVEFLTNYRFDSFGDYDDTSLGATMDGPRGKAIKKAISEFRNRLREIEVEIDRRNRVRMYPYPYLKPSLVLNSPSI